MHLDDLVGRREEQSAKEYLKRLFSDFGGRVSVSASTRTAQVSFPDARALSSAHARIGGGVRGVRGFRVAPSDLHSATGSRTAVSKGDGNGATWPGGSDGDQAQDSNSPDHCLADTRNGVLRTPSEGAAVTEASVAVAPSGERNPFAFGGDDSMAAAAAYDITGAATDGAKIPKMKRKRKNRKKKAAVSSAEGDTGPEGLSSIATLLQMHPEGASNCDLVIDQSDSMYHVPHVLLQGNVSSWSEEEAFGYDDKSLRRQAVKVEWENMVSDFSGMVKA